MDHARERVSKMELTLIPCILHSQHQIKQMSSCCNAAALFHVLHAADAGPIVCSKHSHTLCSPSLKLGRKDELVLDLEQQVQGDGLRCTISHVPDPTSTHAS